MIEEIISNIFTKKGRLLSRGGGWGALIDALLLLEEIQYEKALTTTLERKTFPSPLSFHEHTVKESLIKFFFQPNGFQRTHVSL